MRDLHRPPFSLSRLIQLRAVRYCTLYADHDLQRLRTGPHGHGDGESRFVESEAVTAKLQSTLQLFDLIVGTEEEFHIAGGSTDTIAALRAVRAVRDATLVCKRGADGAVSQRLPLES